MEHDVGMREAELRLNRLYFNEIEYKRKISSEQLLEYKMNFNREIQSDENDHYSVSLRCNIFEKSEALIEMHVCIVGEFTCETENRELREKLVAQNTVAILFPYLRSQVSLVSTQPDISPIIIPPVNIAAMFDETTKK